MRWSNIEEIQSNIGQTCACGLWLGKQLADSWHAKIYIPCMLLSPQLKLYIKYGKIFWKLNLNPKAILHQLYLIPENGIDQTYCTISKNLIRTQPDCFPKASTTSIVLDGYGLLSRDWKMIPKKIVATSCKSYHF